MLIFHEHLFYKLASLKLLDKCPCIWSFHWSQLEIGYLFLNYFLGHLGRGEGEGMGATDIFYWGPDFSRREAKSSQAEMTTVCPWPPPQPWWTPRPSCGRLPLLSLPGFWAVDTTGCPWWFPRPVVTRFGVVWLKTCQCLCALTFVPVYPIRIGVFSRFFSPL